MKKKMMFQCQDCGHETLKWMGRCSNCNGWNTFQESFKRDSRERAAQLEPALLQPYHEIDPVEGERVNTGFSELDLVLGGGLVGGSVVLIGGSPGVGKSTLMLQVAGFLSGNMKVLYVSGEESAGQLKMRGQRLQVEGKQLYILPETNFETVKEQIKKVNPGVLIIDSIQTMYRPELSSMPGTVTQIREVTAELMQISKMNNMSVFTIGHVTKEGVVAGPRLLEHMVDCVLYLEGDPHHNYLLLRGVKNRFGSTNELGVFHMREKGLVEIKNPSEVFLSRRPENTVGSVVVASLEGSRPLLIEIQALVTPSRHGNPRRMTTGLDSNRVALLMAVLEKKVGLFLQDHDAYLNVVGGVKLNEPAVDLGIAICLASSFKNIPINAQDIFIGELGLTGEVRSVNGLEKRIAEGHKLGFKRSLVPLSGLENASGKSLKGTRGITTLDEALELAFF